MSFGRRLLGRNGALDDGPNLEALTTALGDVPAGFALFDPEDRLVICNPVFREV